MTAFDVYRDPHGIPHVRADDELTLAYGQGWVTAHDRGWQIEVGRWRAEARLAERLGPAGADWDELAHHLHLPDTAQQAYAALDTADRTWIDAYVAGVNAGLTTGGRDVPELHTLDTLPGPAVQHTPWPAWAPLGVFLVNHVLMSGFPHVLWRDHVARTLGPAHPDIDPARLAALLTTDGGPTAGSNAWALHGSRTATGLPILAGDPHRLLELPGIYQQIRLGCDQYDVVGLAFPGVPGVPHYGHTGHTAWGVTNAMAETDVHTERLRHTPHGTTEAYGPHGWEPTTTRHQTIHVRGSHDRHIETIETARGVVVATTPTTGTPTTGTPTTGEHTAWSVHLPPRTLTAVGVHAWRTLLTTRTTDDVTHALTHWIDPVNRVLAADTTGRVTSLHAGRTTTPPPSGRTLPPPAWHTPPPTWAPAPPAIPIHDTAVDANERPAHPDRDHGHTYAPHHRATRIRTLLATRHTTTATDQDHLLGDTRVPTHGLLRWLTPGTHPLADRLHAWNRHATPDSTDMALYATWRTALVRRIATHPALAPFSHPHPYGPVLDPWLSPTGRIADALENLLTATWLGIDPTAEAHAALDDIAALPDIAALADGPECVSRPWGATHVAQPLHVLDGVPGAHDVVSGREGARGAPWRAVVPELPLGGDGECVRSTTSSPGIDDAVWRASVARWVWDLGDRDASRWSVPFGAAGDPRSPHAADQHADWAAARTVPIVTDWARLRPEHLNHPVPEETS
ncbi:Penicillin amidase [Xylanimonas cellulosilytica DSM 15894]|uniref:Penicillin amidase n=1 Tax=Xylanimonas cellulosilytica (strain DSM 15894 / JCM 12276 / CECT 5975 / KCTC 9989 / LMG 20990 / NBRC 107835 / XIL07) TaxID=446471 RepID=D1BSX8_XYLCX|nr:penicillin acylase family protein [Xylanimonas cellulosilytica]ACZ30820.1 Penicillin amidase [Xylanimonas cellulosilytica DSM 15894]